jgi:hypothetical protein
MATFTPDFTASAYMEISYLEISVQDYVRAYRTSKMDTRKMTVFTGLPPATKLVD